MKNSPSCLCCDCICRIFFDEFGSLSGDWSEDSGNWTVSTGLLTTTDDNAQLRLTTPDHDGDSKVSVQFKGSAEDEFYLMLPTFASSPTDTYHRLKVVLAASGSQCGFIYLEWVEAGVVSGTIWSEEVIDGLVADEWHTMSLCFKRIDDDEATLTGRIDPANGQGRSFYNTVSDGSGLATPPYTDAYGVAIGTGLISGTAYFDNLCWQRLRGTGDEHCPDCEPPSCTLFTDDFDRADSTDLGCYWFEINGDFEVDTNVLQVDSTDALAVCAVEHPTRADGHLSATVRFKLADSGDKARIYLPLCATTEADRSVSSTAPSTWCTAYSVVEFEVGTTCGTIRIFECWAGTETQVGGDVPVLGLVPDQWHTGHACFGYARYSTENPDQPVTITLPIGQSPGPYGVYDYLLTGSVTTYQDLSRALVRWLPHGVNLSTLPSAGIGTGDTLTALAQFDDFQLDMSYEPTLSPDCETCYGAMGCIWASSQGQAEELANCDWVEEDGIWTGFYTEDSNAWLRCAIENPLRSNRMRMEGHFICTAEGDEVILRIADDGAGGYLGLKCTVSDTCGSIELIQDGASLSPAQSLPVEPLAVNAYHYFCVQYKDGVLSAQVMPDISIEAADSFFANRALAANNNYRQLAATVTGETGGVYGGVGTGTITGSATFFVYLTFVKDAYIDCYSCESCNLLEDPRDPADECEWDPVSGTVVAEHNGIKISTANGYAAYKGNFNRPDTSILCSIKATVDGQRVRIYINDDGTLSGPWAEMEFADDPTTTVLRLSSSEEYTYPFHTNETYILQLCLSDVGQLSATVYFASLGPQYVVASATGSVGVATDAYAVFELLDVSGDVYLGDTDPLHIGLLGYFVGRVTYAMIDNERVDCMDCYVACECCENLVGPDEWVAEVVDLLGIGAACATGGECDYNGAYTAVASTECNWEFNWGDVCDDLNTCFCDTPSYLYLEMSCDTVVTIDAEMYVQPDYPNPGCYMRWRYTHATDTMDCTGTSQWPLVPYEVDAMDPDAWAGPGGTWWSAPPDSSILLTAG